MSSYDYYVLIVEDNPGDSRLVEEYLRDIPECKFQTTVADRLEKAIEIVKKIQRPDIILLDLDLPDSKGINTFLTMFEEEKGIPIVVVTSHEAEKYGIKALEEGAQDYIVKDVINSNNLSRIIRYSVGRWRLIESMRSNAKELRARAEELELALHKKPSEHSKAMRRVAENLRSIAKAAEEVG